MKSCLSLGHESTSGELKVDVIEPDAAGHNFEELYAAVESADTHGCDGIHPVCHEKFCGQFPVAFVARVRISVPYLVTDLIHFGRHFLRTSFICFITKGILVHVSW